MTESGCCSAGCAYFKRCTWYPYKSERLFPNVIRHRNFQAKFWEMCTPELFVYELNKFSYNKLRFSESGDFRSQKDVDKASAIADLLDIPVWTYTTRRDLDFTNLPANFPLTAPDL